MKTRRPARTIRARSLLLAGACLLLMTRPLVADDWADPRKDRLEDELARLERPDRELAEDAASLVTLRHGDVRLVADLARVDLTLEIRNTSGERLEWQRTFAMDPRAEAIGATLSRQTGAPIEARTLTLESARRIYGETVRPPTPRWPQGWGRTRDPLRVERTQRDRLEVIVFPVEAGETVRVNLQFVAPLRGRGDLRTYVDVLGAELDVPAAPAARRTTRPVTPRGGVAADASPAAGAVSDQWMFRAGTLALASASVGLLPAGDAGGVLRLVATPELRRDTAPTVEFRQARAPSTAVAVKGGGLGTLVATWRFDPTAWLEARGIRPEAGMEVRILKRRGSTSRIAPWSFSALDEPLPVTARLSPGATALRYAVEVRTQAGEVVALVEEERAYERASLEPELEGAITGWHRAALVERVIAWAGTDAARRDRALAYAVDLGVLVPGTAALALPRQEQRDLSGQSRREYRTDGAELGAQDGEADLTPPPSGSLSP